MYILFGHSIHNGMTFIGPYDTETAANEAMREIDFDETYEDLAHQYDFEVIELINSPIMAKHFNWNEYTQVM